MTRPAFITAAEEDRFRAKFREFSESASGAEFDIAQLMSTILQRYEANADQPVSAFKYYVAGLFGVREPTQRKYVRMARAYQDFIESYDEPRTVWQAYGGWSTVTIFDGLSDSDRDRFENALWEEVASLGDFITTDSARTIMDRLGIRTKRSGGRTAGAGMTADEEARICRMVRRLGEAGRTAPSRRTRADNEILAASADPRTLVASALRD